MGGGGGGGGGLAPVACNFFPGRYITGRAYEWVRGRGGYGVFCSPAFSFSSCFVLVDYTRAYTKVLVF